MISETDESDEDDDREDEADDGEEEADDLPLAGDVVGAPAVREPAAEQAAEPSQRMWEYTLLLNDLI